MSKIQVLDQITIDKIAAGEVIERPASVVKELVENSIDAGASSVTVEIKEGGISSIRIADNGCGIPKDEVRPAFLRHSTSKIRSVDDLMHICSLGFRGEALSSIAAVAQVELLTKTKEDAFGTRYRIAGGAEESLEDDSAPDGTTFFIRQLFYNVPARRKFLKTAMTEASHVGDLMTRLALSHPEISFHFINNGQSKIHTSGNGNLKDVIYHIYGREIAANLLPANYDKNGVRITGFLGAPLISRGNRNFENYFINYRYIKNNMVYKAIEDAYKDFTMQHKFPFVVLHVELNGEEVDVNVHPSKLEIRFHNQQEIYNAIYEAVETGLHEKELIPHITVDVPGAKASGAKTVKAGASGADTVQAETAAEEGPPKKAIPPKEERTLDYFMEEMKKRVTSYHEQNSSAEITGKGSLFKPKRQADWIRETVAPYRADYSRDERIIRDERTIQECPKQPEQTIEASKQPEQAAEEPKQLDLFEERFLDRKVQAEYKLIGQIFDTYWLVEYHDQLFIIDQHAAHERLIYNRLVARTKTREALSQPMLLPFVLNVNAEEYAFLAKQLPLLRELGFEAEEFGGTSIKVSAVPLDLQGIDLNAFFGEVLATMESYRGIKLAEILKDKLASAACKAAVKGGESLSDEEVKSLIREMDGDMGLRCPHGRPVAVKMKKSELEKLFKRIV